MGRHHAATQSVRSDRSGQLPGGQAGTTSSGERPTIPQVDPLPLEAVVGWDASLNGNLAQLLQEPSLMGALEGAGITVLAKGVELPSGCRTRYDSRAAFPTGTTLLTGTVSAAGATALAMPMRSATPAAESRPIRSPATSSATRRASMAWASPTAPRAAAASSSTPGAITCKSPTTGSTTTRERSPAASTSARVNSLRRTSRAPRTNADPRLLRDLGSESPPTRSCRTART